MNSEILRIATRSKGRWDVYLGGRCVFYNGALKSAIKEFLRIKNSTFCDVSDPPIYVGIHPGDYLDSNLADIVEYAKFMDVEIRTVFEDRNIVVCGPLRATRVRAIAFHNKMRREGFETVCNYGKGVVIYKFEK